MRLLKLELLNLNALYGEHSIDFEAQLQQAPLFLISGPTGAGKSTLLDAISLALFGVTPRLRDEGPRENQADQKPENALSRGTAQGKAALTFRKSSPGQDSVTYRATWEVWLGNKRHPKVNGSLQGPYRWLERSTRGQPEWITLATDYQGRTKDLEAAMSEALEGFSLQDFTRCMLLAQGDFAAFLKASEAERGAILERLTQTETYKQLGARAAQRLRDAKAICERVEVGLGALKVLPEAEVAALEQVLTDHEREASSAEAHAEAAKERLQWLERDASLHEATQEAAVARAEVESACVSAKPGMERLAAFEAATEALTHCARVRHSRSTAENLEVCLSAQQKEAQAQVAQVALATEAGTAAKQALHAAQQALAEKEPLLEQARGLRLAKDAATKEMAAALQRSAAANQRLVDNEKKLFAATEARRERTEAADRSSRVLEALLPTGLAPPEARRQLEAHRDNQLRRQLALVAAKEKLEEALRAESEATDREAVAAIQARQSEEARAHNEAARQAAERTEAEVETLRRQLELLSWAREVAQQRGRLAEGVPCPLCGAVSHPAVTDPARESKDAQVQAECDRLEHALSAARKALDEARPRAQAALAAAERAEAESNAAAKQASASRVSASQARDAAQTLAQALGVAEGVTELESEAEAAQALVERLTAQRDAVEQALTSAQRTATDRTEAEAVQRLASQSVQEAQREAAARGQEVKERQIALAEAEAKGANCLGGLDPEPIHRQLKAELAARDEAHAAARDRYVRCRDLLANAVAARDETARTLGREQQGLIEAEALLAQLLVSHGDEATLLAKALPEAEARELSGLRARLDEARREALARCKALQEQRQRHQEERPADLDPMAGKAPLELQLALSREHARTHLAAAASARAAIWAQLEAKTAQAQALETLAAARAELVVWSRMNQLIGVREGESFRRFAQVLNLRELLDKANARLERLRPRYRLVPAKDEQGMDRLAFAVEDSAHAGLVRPVGTLSGGETFLISLSLALALADYRTVRMPIETLLLDEGFGTLDSATLSDVLGTLGSLTGQGTQVGLISHVEALQEKIPARILVEPVAQGRSRIRVISGAT